MAADLMHDHAIAAVQYLCFHAAPYEVIAFKVPNMEVEKTDKFFTHWCAL
jgi:Pre-mRNA-splicing factor SF3a complex subunit 2 (Prp11)